MPTIIRNVREIAAEDRSSLERIVGIPLHDQARLVIQVDPLPTLPEWCNVFAGMSPAEVDEIDSRIVRNSSSRIIE
jgi:hypothetical protein